MLKKDNKDTLAIVLSNYLKNTTFPCIPKSTMAHCYGIKYSCDPSS